MLEIITGRAGTGKTELCLQTIVAGMKESAWGARQFLLVPEHMTFKVEQELLARLAQNGYGTLRCSVFGFQRFARQILLETGGLLEPQLTETGRRLILRRLLLARKEELQEFSGLVRRRGFAASLGNIIREFKCYGIKPEDLTVTAEKITVKRLQGKLKELGTVYADFNMAVSGVYRDSEDLLERLITRLPQAKMLNGAEFWLDGFTFFNPQERAVIRALLQQGLTLHVTLPLAAQGSQENELTGIFSRAQETKDKLVQLAQECGTNVEFKFLSERHRYRSPELGQLEQGIYGEVQRKIAAFGGLQLVEAANARLEMEAAAADIIRLCREKGLHWREIGILIRDDECYGMLLPLVLQDYHIPFFSDKKRPAARHPLAELLRSAWETVRTGWRYDSIFRALKTGFFPLTDEELDFLENYVLEFGLRGKKCWLMDEPWKGQKHDNCDEMAVSQLQQARDLRADVLRRRVAEPLGLFATALEQAVDAVKDENSMSSHPGELSVAAAAEALYGLLTSLQAAESLTAWADEAERHGRLTEAQEHRQVWEEIITLLEQLVEVSQEDTMTLTEMGDMLEEGLDALEVSLIPPGLDYVTVASFDQNSLANYKAIYILGVNAGVMPRRTSEDVILSDSDRLQLRENGKLEFPLVSQDSSFNEKYLLYRGFTQARDYLWVSYALADNQGEGRLQASLVKRIKKIIATDNVFVSIPLESLERQNEKLQVAEGAQSVSALASALRACRERGTLPGLWCEVYNQTSKQEKLLPALNKVKAGLFYQPDGDKLSAELAGRLFAPHQKLYGSVTSFERYQQCPFKYFAEKGLKLQERKLYGFQYNDLGTLLHAVLEGFGREQQRKGRRWSETTTAERRQFCQDSLNHFAQAAAGGALLQDGRRKVQLEKIGRTAEAVLNRLCQLDAGSKFHPEYFELPFCTEQGRPALDYPLSRGARLVLHGQIDRLDVGEARQRFLVIDYKTGQAGIDLRQVYYGLKLQLLTYILAAQEILRQGKDEELEPAGMLYYFVRDDLLNLKVWPDLASVTKVQQEAERLTGWLVSDTGEANNAEEAEALAQEMDRTDSLLAYLKGKKEKYMKTDAQLTNLLLFTVEKLKQTGELILAGEVMVHPYRDDKGTACTYCGFSTLCHFEPELQSGSYRDLVKKSEDEWWQLIEKELTRQKAEGDA